MPKRRSALLTKLTEKDGQTKRDKISLIQILQSQKIYSENHFSLLEINIEHVAYILKSSARFQCSIMPIKSF